MAREGLKRARREQDHDADRDADRDTDHAHSDHNRADRPVHHVNDQDSGLLVDASAPCALYARQ